MVERDRQPRVRGEGRRQARERKSRSQALPDTPFPRPKPLPPIFSVRLRVLVATDDAEGPPIPHSSSFQAKREFRNRDAPHAEPNRVTRDFFGPLPVRLAP